MGNDQVARAGHLLLADVSLTRRRAGLPFDDFSLPPLWEFLDFLPFPTTYQHFNKGVVALKQKVLKVLNPKTTNPLGRFHSVGARIRTTVGLQPKALEVS
jgi:hypothetical protein